MQYIAAHEEKLGQYYPKAVFDYLQNAAELKPFYEHYPNLEGYGEVIKNRRFSAENRKVLHKVLTDQYGDLLQQPNGAAVQKNIDALLDENTFTITTGQQIHIYLGPLYVAYKILTTIARCSWLEENFKGHKFVPVFWMATEDHDFEEISHLNLYNREFKWPQTEGFAGAVGRLSPATINNLEADIAALVQNDEEAKKLLAMFTDAYAKYPTLADATRAVTHQLFGHTGLVVIDADDKALKQQFIPYIKDDIFKGQNVGVVSKTSEQLGQNYKTQIHPRDINFFYLTDNSRTRIVKEENAYKVLDSAIVFDEAVLRNEIDTNPEKFSPNVIMRPLYQEVILPNLAYVGGPAEVNYWFQLKEMFGINGVQFPILELRKSLIVLNEKTVEKIASIGFAPIDFMTDEKELEAAFLEENTVESLDLSAHYKTIATELETIKSAALGMDANLKPFIEGEFKRITETFEKLDNKLEKVSKRSVEGQLKVIETVKTKFFKPGALSERVDTILSVPQLSDEKVIGNLIKTFNHENKPLIILLPPLV